MNTLISRFVAIMVVLLLGMAGPASAQENKVDSSLDQPDPFEVSDAECKKRDSIKCNVESRPGKTLRESIANVRPWLDFPVTEQEVLDVNGWKKDMLDKKVTPGLWYKLTDNMSDSELAALEEFMKDPFRVSNAECKKRDNKVCNAEFRPGKTLRESIARMGEQLGFQIDEQEVLDVHGWEKYMLDEEVPVDLYYKLTDDIPPQVGGS